MVNTVKEVINCRYELSDRAATVAITTTIVFALYGIGVFIQSMVSAIL